MGDIFDKTTGPGQAPAQVQSPAPQTQTGDIFDKTVGAPGTDSEPKIQMYLPDHEDTPEDVPASQIDAKRQAGYFPVLTQSQKNAYEATEGVKSSASGNAAIMAAPLLVPAAATQAGEAALTPVVDAAANVASKAVSAAGPYMSAGSEMLAKLAAEHPLAAKAVKAYTGWLAVHLAHKVGIPLPKILEFIGE